jgi:adenosine kinase
MNFPDHFKNHIMSDKIHILNVSFVVETVEERFGGTAGNIAYNLALLGEHPCLVSAVGEDFAPYKKHLEENGIDISRITVIPDKKTAFASIITDLDDNQIAAFYAGALDDAPVSAHIPEDAEIAIVSPESKDIMIERVRCYQTGGLRYVFDPAQQLARFNGEELRQCAKGAHLVIGNDYEIGLFEQKTGWSIKEIAKHAELVVVTYGEKGSRVYAEKGSRVVEIAAVKPEKFIDPTGAGDAYRAGFVAGLLDEKSLEECGNLASHIAAKAICYYGAQEHRFTREEVFAII